MKALVIGAEGFVGRHLCPMMRAAGYAVSTTEHFAPFALWSLLPFDVVVHLGANTTKINVNDRMTTGMRAYSDIVLDYEVCSWIEQNPPSKCFIAMSSCARDNVDDPYCVNKITLEHFAHTLIKKGVPVVILRPYGGYGPDQSEEYPFRAIFERAMRREDPLVVWGHGQLRDFVWIDDLCEGIMAAIDYFPRGREYALGTGRATSFPELARLIANVISPAYSPTVFCDTTKAASGKCRVAPACGLPGLWMPKVSLEEGIQKSVEYFRRHGKLKA